MFTKAIAVEYARRHIRCNSVNPGIINSGMIKPYLDDPQARKVIEERIPLVRIGEPEDVANAALFLASDEASWVTGLKTAASTAVTTAYLARPESETLTIFGAGTLGRLHLIAVAERFKLKQAYFVDIKLEVAEACAAELEPNLGFPVEAISLENRENVVRGSDIIFTVTTGNQALFEHAWLKPGTFITRLGSYQEVDHDVITKADKVVVDCWKYVSPRIPEIIALVDKGEFSMENIYAEWPLIVAKKVPGREAADEIIVYIALGIWGEYAAILPEVFKRAKTLGLGQALPCSH